MVRRHNEQVGLTFDDVAIGMRVFLKDLYGSEAHLNGEAATVLAGQPSTGFCTVEVESDGRKYHFEPLNLYVTAAGSNGQADWAAITAADGRTYYHNRTTGETSWERPAALDAPAEGGRCQRSFSGAPPV